MANITVVLADRDILEISFMLKRKYCKKCKRYANHRVTKNNKRLSCLYCESLKKKKKWGVAKSKPKGGWSKLHFGINTN